MSKILRIVLLLACVAASIFGIIMTIMAVRFMEFGRVIFYFLISMICLEFAVLLIMSLRNCKS